MYKEGIEFYNSINLNEIKPGLDRMEKLLSKMGNFHHFLKVIHIAGTNGKGSTSAYINRMLVDQNYKVGIFNSPWLFKINECIRVNDEEISEAALNELFIELKTVLQDLPQDEYPSSFELLTACAMLHFYKQGCDLVILECGMGGSTDATNVIKESLVAVFTPIDMDHQSFLGSTLEEIAQNKAGIMKKASFAVSARQERAVLEVLKREALARELELSYCADCDYSLEVGLLGDFQKENATLALEAVRQLKKCGYELDMDRCRESLKKTAWPLRLEMLSPKLIVDGAHNLNGINAVVDFMKKEFENKTFRLIYGGLKDKDISGIIKKISALSKEINLTMPKNERAETLENMSAIANKYFESVNVYRDTKEALGEALKRTGDDEIIIALGSLYIAKEIKEEWMKCYTIVQEA